MYEVCTRILILIVFFFFILYVIPFTVVIWELTVPLLLTLPECKIALFGVSKSLIFTLTHGGCKINISQTRSRRLMLQDAAFPVRSEAFDEGEVCFKG